MRRLRLLGPACVDRIPKTPKTTAKSAGDERNAGGAPRFRSRRTVALLGYLAAERRSVARDFLAALFWPDEATSTGRSNLRREVHNLAQILPDCWELDHQAVAFVPSADVAVDTYTLLQLEAEERWGEAAELLGGEFLEGLYLGDNLEFENWLLGERERWRGRAEAVLGRVIEGHTRRGRYTDALRHVRRLLQLVPWNEKAHRQAMQLLAWTGQRGAALRQSETCKRALWEELGVEPAGETTALCQQILAGELDLPPQLPAFLTEEGARHKVDRPIFVARERELAQLDAFLNGALAGQGRVIFVTGGPGRGKTALLDAFVRRAMEAHPDLLIASGNCNAYSGVGDPYLPYREVMAMLTGDVEARWDAGAITRDHAQRLWAALPLVVQALLDHGPHLVDVLAPGAALLSRATIVEQAGAPWLPRLREHVNRRGAGSQEVEQSDLFQQVTNVLRTVAREQPLLLILDDVQWADAASISLLFHLGRGLVGADSRLLIACAYRPEEVALGRPATSLSTLRQAQDGAGSGQAQRHPLAKVLTEFKRTFGDVWVHLGRAEEMEKRRFVDALLDAEPNRLAEGFRATLFHRTGGHPLFTIELLRAMQNRGDLLKDADGEWIEGPTLDWQVLPARVEAVIEERIDRLDPELQDILTIASVEGEVFTAQVVAKVRNVPERALLRRLSQDLERRHRLVREQEEVETGQRRLSRYRFDHVLFQDFLYKRLGQGEQRLLHGDVAAALEELYAGQLDEMTVQLAHHWERAGDAEKAVHYLLQAGDQARLAYAHAEAIDYYQRRLAFLKDGEAFEEASRTLMKLGLTYHTAFDYQASRQAYDEAFAMRQRERIAPSAALAPAPHPLRLVRSEPPTLDSTIENNAISEFYIENIFSGLVELGTGWEIIPDVAQSWEISEDGCRYVFHLRDDVYWSDGTQVTAADFVYAWKRTLNPATEAPWGAASLLYDIKNAKAYHLGELSDPDQVGARAIDALALEVELERPAGNFLQTLIFRYPVPRHVVEAHGDDWTDLGNLVTNGPFHLESYQPGESIILVRNLAYHGQFSGNLQRVEVKLNVPGRSSENLEMYESDSVDIVRLDESTYPARHPHVEEYISGPWPGTWYVGFNTSRPPFDNPRVRRAFVMAVDREKLANELLEGYLYPATGGFVPPGMPGHSPGIGLPYDPDHARQLLAQAGYPEGRGFPSLELVYTRVRNVLEFLKAQWLNNLNVEVTIGIREWAKVIKEQHSRNIFYTGWSTEYPDPEYFLGVGVRSQVPHWRNENYDPLLKEARRTSNQGDRIPLYQAADKILIEEAVIMPICYVRRHRLVKPRVKIPGEGTGIWHLKDVIIEPH